MKKFVMKHERGAKLDGWYVWDTEENRVVIGKRTKREALNILHLGNVEKQLTLREKVGN